MIPSGARRWRWIGAIAAVVVAGGAGAGGPGDGRVTRDGVVVEFSLEPAGGGVLREGDHAEARFRIRDAASGRPLSGLKPAAWLDVSRESGAAPRDDRACREKVALYLKGSVGIRPLVDLNSYYLLVMNQDASVSVIDPVVSMTGNTSLFASILLKRPAADWTKSRDEKRLFVSMPRANEIAVVDTEHFKVVRSVPAGEQPVRVVRQNDGRYLWVGNDAAGDASGVTVLDTATLEPVAHVATGRGHHEIALSPDDRYAFVTNREAGTVSVVDVAQLRKVKDLPTGPTPLSIAVSPLSQAIYVADGTAGTIAVIDPARLEVRSTIRTRPGLGPVRFTWDGRWGFFVNPATRSVLVLDASSDQVIHEIDVGAKPYQVSVTRAFAYVRLLDSEQVKMINLLSLGEGRRPIVQGFAAGTAAPSVVGDLGIADSVTPANTEAAVFVVNPADNTTSFYMEGMNAPMGSFGSYGHAARAVTVVDRSVKEVEPGVYTANVRVPVAGSYDVAFLLDNPRVLHCFHADAQPNPAHPGKLAKVRVEFVDVPVRARSGTLPLRIRLSDGATRQPRAGLTDVVVLYHAVTGPRRHVTARAVAEGVYEAQLPLDDPGTYYLFVDVPSLGVNPHELPYRSVVVERAAVPAPRNG